VSEKAEVTGQDAGEQKVNKEGEDRHTEAMAALKEELVRAQGTIEALSKTPQKTEAAPVVEKTKKFAVPELRKMVDDGTISQDQMDEQIRQQRDVEIEAKMEAKFEKRLAKARIEDTVTSEIASYKKLHPDLGKQSSEDWQKVKRAFDGLVAKGHSKNSLTTEHTALQIVYGDIDEQRQIKGRPKPPESFEDVGGASGSSGGGDTGGPEWSKDVSSRVRAHYQKKLDSGFYKGAADPDFKKELEYARGQAS